MTCVCVLRQKETRLAVALARRGQNGEIAGVGRGKPPGTRWSHPSSFFALLLCRQNCDITRPTVKGGDVLAVMYCIILYSGYLTYETSSSVMPGSGHVQVHLESQPDQATLPSRFPFGESTSPCRHCEFCHQHHDTCFTMVKDASFCHN